MDLQDAITRPVIVHVVDASSNRHGFEHDCTQAMSVVFRRAGVQVTRSSPHLTMNVADLKRAFAVEDAWNVLLYVERDARWPLATHVGLNVARKLVFLCMYEGDPTGSASSIFRQQGAACVVAPTAAIHTAQALTFFPRVIQDLHETGLDADHVALAVHQRNPRTGGVMALRK